MDDNNNMGALISKNYLKMRCTNFVVVRTNDGGWDCRCCCGCCNILFDIGGTTFLYQWHNLSLSSVHVVEGGHFGGITMMHLQARCRWVRYKGKG